MEEALAAFVAACNRRDTLFITKAWFQPRAERLRRGLSDPITAEEAHVLRELLRERVTFDVVFGWMDRRPMSWTDYLDWREAELKRQAMLRMERGIFPWEDVAASREDTKLQIGALAKHARPEPRPCPRCQKPLTWIYFSSPPWTWRMLCGRAGWIAVCDDCHLQVDFKLTMMN